ncbi:MAG: hypothetical protein K0U93_19915 [Gammaproteobacteria bacterium]|nr:hypothetical protein [Gammaproteobacteria bacterium]
MPIAVSARTALATRRCGILKEVIEKPFYRRLYMGSEPKGGGVVDEQKLAMPQAYLVEQPSDSTVATHFHDTNQFQVFVHGVGAFGRKPLDGLMVHYAGAHTAYGPIAAGGDGIHYMTLRNNWDSGAKTLPENRHRMRSVTRVHRFAENVMPSAPSLAKDTVARTDLIALEEDGLGVCRFDIGPARVCDIGFEFEGAGAYALVIAGEVEHEGDDYETHSLIYVAEDESPISVTAGSAGASVLFLQFPPEPTFADSEPS